MHPNLKKLYKKLKENGLSPEKEEKIQRELEYEGSHGLPGDGLPGTAQHTQRQYSLH